ncbi:MAG: sel1 repeat family protein, partial [Chlorobi bacterium]|nr:sel1 repeat family protein [Chlorobiota bacterium]
MKILLLAVALGVVGSLSGQPFLPSSHPRTSKSTDTITAHVIANIWWGIGCASDFERACDVAAQWADRDPIAAFIYAECLTDRRRCPCQYRRADSLRTAAIDALRRRADSGDSYALVALAECYRRSLGGMAPSEDSASALIARAAALGNPLAAFMLATETSDSSVQRLLSRAVEGQVVAAMVARARRLLADTMTTTEAIALLCRADSLGSPDAALLLGGCYDSGFGVERNPTLALQHIAVAADRGSIPAMLELGIRSLWGAGIPADTIGGLNWLLTALARSIPATRSAIVALLVGVRDSLPAVMRWIDRAVHRFAIRYDH